MVLCRYANSYKVYASVQWAPAAALVRPLRMNRRTFVGTLCSVPAAARTALAAVGGKRAKASGPGAGWTPLFDGRGLDSWERWLAQHGLERDPRSVFDTVDLDGGRVIRISGEQF